MSTVGSAARIPFMEISPKLDSFRADTIELTILPSAEESPTEFYLLALIAS